METYTFLRQLADSWVLLLMTLFYLGVFGWAFRPGSRRVHDDIALIPLRDEAADAPDRIQTPEILTPKASSAQKGEPNNG